MAVRLSGIPVAREMRGRIQAGVEQLHQIGQIPTMGIVRVGARPEDISYETGATKLALSLIHIWAPAYESGTGPEGDQT